ncbi:MULTISPECIES: glycine zipper family protein [unclassified Bartonella]|uniref:glycine zipper family protein n=1 Tax=unclassified Bartonella TaxID=2645622 RepID=UPI0035D0AC17
MAPYKTSGAINSQYVYAKNGTRFRVVEDSAEIEKIIRSNANSSSSSSPRYVYAKNGTRFRVVEDPAEIAKLSNQSTTTDDFSFDDKDLTVLDAVMRNSASGATADYFDEMKAANEAGFIDYWRGDKKAEEIYNRRVAKERAYQKALQEKYPIWSSIAYAAGSLVPTGLSLFVPPLRALALAKHMSTLGNIGKAMMFGAGSGALHGSGAGEGLSGRLISAGFGGGIGTVAGPIGSLAGTVASWGTKKMARGLQHVPYIPFMKGGRFNPAHKEVQTKVVREVAKTLYDDGVENVAEHLANAPRHAFLTDISPNLEVLLANMGTTNTRVSELLKRAHEGRMQGAVQRLGQSADENITPLQDTKVLKRLLKEQGEEAHGSLYAQAYRTPIEKRYYPALNRLFKQEGFQDALKHAVKKLERDPRTAIPQRFYAKEFSHINYKPTMELLDRSKKSLDVLIRMNRKLGDEEGASTYQILKNNLVKITDKISPTYKAARGSAAKYKGFAEAISQGKKIAERDVSGEGIAEGLRKGAMPSGLNTYHVGMRDYIDDLLKGSRPINSLSNILQTGSMSDNLSRSLSSKNIHAFRKAVEGERFYEDAAKRALKPFQGTPEHNYLTGVNIPYGKTSAAHAGAKIIQNILSDTIRKLPQKERQILERDIAKLATFGVKGMNQKEVAQMLQRFIQLHKAGIGSDHFWHFISSAALGEAGRFLRSKG